MTPVESTQIANYLEAHELGHGLGTEERPCSIAAINLALGHGLSDKDPGACMDPSIRSWIIEIQDDMPLDMMSPNTEHGRRWRSLLPYVAGSREHPPPAQMYLDWMWERLGDEAVLEAVPAAARDKWETMLRERTADAARDATAAYDAAYAYAYAATAATAAYAYATAVALAAADAARAAYWHRADPAGLLAKLLERGSK